MDIKTLLKVYNIHEDYDIGHYDMPLIFFIVFLRSKVLFGRPHIVKYGPIIRKWHGIICSHIKVN